MCSWWWWVCLTFSLSLFLCVRHWFWFYSIFTQRKLSIAILFDGKQLNVMQSITIATKKYDLMCGFISTVHMNEHCSMEWCTFTAHYLYIYQTLSIINNDKCERYKIDDSFRLYYVWSYAYILRQKADSSWIFFLFFLFIASCALLGICCCEVDERVCLFIFFLSCNFACVSLSLWPTWNSIQILLHLILKTDLFPFDCWWFLISWGAAKVSISNNNNNQSWHIYVDISSPSQSGTYWLHFNG